MKKTRRFLTDTRFYILFAAAALVIDIAGSGSRMVLAGGILLLAACTGVILLITDDLLPVLATALITMLTASRCYNSYALFLGRPLIFLTLPVSVFVIGALIYNLIRFRRPLRTGASLRGIIAVAAAVTLGGLGSISFSDYAGAAYYVVLLGAGMVGLYLLVKSRVCGQSSDDLKEKLAVVFCVMGVFAAVLTLRSFIWELKPILFSGDVPNWKFRNNFSTFMMIAMPAPLCFAKKNHLFLLLSVAIYAAMILLGSRGGLFLGTAELVLCMIFMSVADRPWRWHYVGMIVLFALVAALGSGLILGYFSSRTGGGMIDANEQRARLLIRSISDFTDSPIFGKGLGYTGNFDIYTPKKGAMGWYHMMIPQIIGSMGVVGVLAYGYQFFNRFKIVFRSREHSSWVLAMCYVGLLMMSQVNPGEFCPVPYELMAVLIFAVIEDSRPAFPVLCRKTPADGANGDKVPQER